MAKGFKFWTGDVNWLDHGGTWIRKVGDRRYHFICLTNMDEAVGSDNEGRPKYVVELSEVDLEQISSKVQVSAWHSCDGDSMAGDDEISSERGDQLIASCCFDYGAKAPLHSVDTDSAHKGIRECKAESKRLDDAHERGLAMTKPVNAIGSTAKEYMTGDLDSAISRGVADGSKEALLMAKIMKGGK